MSAFDNYRALQCELAECAAKGGFDPAQLKVLAVTKNQPSEVIRELYDAGLREFAENRINILEEKMKLLPDDIVWHFIGKIQSNKVRKVVRAAKVLHSVDSPELLERIERIAGEENVSPELFIEVNISGEESKSGISACELEKMLEVQLKHAKIAGLMTMAPFDANAEQLEHIFTTLKKTADRHQLKKLSMGMSNDCRIAAACGATIVRIGTALFV
jgi:pyridoxal phosphate enzyme (YggS family)